jgi:hypothetical protein
MKHQILWLGLLFASLGCSGKKACEGFSNPAPLSSELPAETFELVEAGDRALVGARADLTGLPELWQRDTSILYGSFWLKLAFSYREEPIGGDGLTEMPRVRVRQGENGVFGAYGVDTERFPRNPAAFWEYRIFETCVDETDRDCCEYGARECSIQYEFQLERLDGEPFPPLVVESSIEVDADVTTCPLGEGAPKLTLTRVE